MNGPRLLSPPASFGMPEDEYERRIGGHSGLDRGWALYRLYVRFGGDLVFLQACLHHIRTIAAFSLMRHRCCRPAGCSFFWGLSQNTRR